MLDKPYDLNVSEEEFTKANTWWRSLSLSQWLAFESKYFPNYPLPLSKRAIHQIWEIEGIVEKLKEDEALNKKEDEEAFNEWLILHQYL